ncbi:hypothetical protein [Nocardia sp. NBC_01377]
MQLRRHLRCDDELAAKGGFGALVAVEEFQRLVSRGDQLVVAFQLELG